MRNAYFALLILMAVAASLFFAANRLARYSIQKFDEVYLQLLIDHRSDYCGIEDDLPWMIGVVHRNLLRLPAKRNLFIMGASQAREGFWPPTLEVPNGWNYQNIAMSSDTIKSLCLMSNYLEEVAKHPPNRSDAVVVFINWLTLRSPKDDRGDFLKLAIEQFNQYQVDQDQHIHGKPSWLMHELAIIRYRIYAAVSWPLGWPLQEPNIDIATARLVLRVVMTGKLIPFRPEITFTNSEAQIEVFKESWAKASTNIVIPSDGSEKMIQFLLEMSEKTNVIVVNQYRPSFCDDFQIRKDYDAWVEATLLPTLKAHNIPYLDFSKSMQDEEFLDGGHLTLPGRIRHGKILMDQLKQVLPKD